MKAIKFSLSAIALGLSTHVMADVPTGYYDSVITSSPAEMKHSIHLIIRGHKRFPYTSDETDTWDILETADQHPEMDTHIIDVYKNSSYEKKTGGNDDYNREHSWPKSYGFPDNGDMNYPYTDTHHLFLSDSSYNSARSNKPFANCESGCSDYATETNAGRGGTADEVNKTKGDYSDGKWETWDGRKGDVARALLYMAVRYEGGTHPETGAMEPDLELTDDVTLIENSRTNDNEARGYMGYLSTLIEWHNADPVDDVERTRNEAIYSFQENRNPFIDNPEWVSCVFESECPDSTADTVAPATVTGVTATIQNGTEVVVTWTAVTEADVFGYRVELANSATGNTIIHEVSGMDTTTLTVSDLGHENTFAITIVAIDNYYNESAASAAVNVTTSEAPGVVEGALWINEIHYDNSSTDQNEFVEIAGPIATDTAGWTVVLYNGNGGRAYATLSLDSALSNESNGIGFLAIYPDSIQNGGSDADGIALVNPDGAVVQFISYEGHFVAEDGAAAGIASTDIGVEETSNTGADQSMQLTGQGTDYAAFTWQVDLTATPGAVNESQTFPASDGGDGGDNGGDDGSDDGSEDDAGEEPEKKDSSSSSMSWWLFPLAAGLFARRYALRK